MPKTSPNDPGIKIKNRKKNKILRKKYKSYNFVENDYFDPTLASKTYKN